MIRVLSHILLVILVSCYSDLTGQQNSFLIQNNTYDSVTSDLYNTYSKVMKDGGRLLNGPEYYHDDFSTGGKPFFGTKTFHSGSIFFEEHLYENIDIGYDIFRGEVFISAYDQNRKLSMINVPVEKVRGFSLEGEVFIRLDENFESKNYPGNGFYQLLYDGDSKVLVKRKKKITPSDDDLYKFEFSSVDELYVFQNQSFNRIRTKKALKELLADQKRAIRKFSKEYRFELKELESYVRTICRYYDSLKEESR